MKTSVQGKIRRVLKVSDYDSIQDAVNAAGEYDIVLLPKGEYKTGSVRLKSCLTLRFEAGAKVIASHRIRDYRRCERNHRPLFSGYLFGAYGVQNLTIEGDGEILGEGEIFWKNFESGMEPLHEVTNIGKFQPKEKRPVLFHIVDSSEIILRGFTVRNAPAYTIHLLGCNRVQVKNLTVRNRRKGPNTDVLDLDCCADVQVSGCDFDSGDDCIALKSDIALLGRNQACERIVVSNCVFSSTTCAFRLGYEGDGDIRDVILSANIIYDTRKGFDMLSVLPGRFGIKQGAKIENIICSDTVMRNVRHAFFLWSGAEVPGNYSGYIRNIVFSNITAECLDASFIGGDDVSGITLSNVRLNITRDWDAYKNDAPVTVPNVWGYGLMLKPLTFHQTTPVLHNVVIQQNPRVNAVPTEEQQNH